MPEKTKKPAIRFQEFTDAWEERKVGEVTEELEQYTTLQSGFPLLTSSRSGLMMQNEYRDNTSTDNQDALFSIVPMGASTYRHMSDDDIFHFNINEIVQNGLVSREYPVFIASKGNNLFAIIQYLNSSTKFRAFCREQKMGGTRTRLYYKSLCKFELLLPLEKEQDRIADVFKKINNLITLHQRKYDKLLNIKKFMLEKMFPKNGANVPEIRFAGFSAAWEQRKVGEMITVYPYKPYLAVPSVDGKTEVIQQGNDPILGYANGTPFTNYQAITLFGDHTVSLYKARCPFFVASDGIKILSPKELRGDFFYHLLERYKPIPEGYKRHFTILQERDCFFPQNEAEQNKISTLLTDLDTLITLHQRELEKLKTIKKSCLEKMFV